MKKKWLKISNNIYQFSVNERIIGSLELSPNRSKEMDIIHYNNEQFFITRTGFWKSNILVTDSSKKVIAKTYFEKWYASNARLDYNNTTFVLLTRNNPLFEWVIKLNGKDVLSYGLSSKNSKRMIDIKITTADSENIFLFDFILWYLFLPVAIEQMSYNFTFSNSND